MACSSNSPVSLMRCVVLSKCSARWKSETPGVPPERRIEFRMGINVGDVIRDGRDIYGDGVNVVARLEALAEPGGICVSRVVRDQVRDKLELSIEDMGEQQVKNIARPVRVHRIVLDESPPAAPPQATEGSTKSPLALPDKPSIAVLPFQNMSGDPEQEYFADGMVEEIITALSRIKWLFVIARNSSFTYKGQPVDVTRVGRELGVRYVLEGSVRKGGNQVRITAQLIDAANGAHLWAGWYDGSLENVFDLQDKVALGVVGVIEPTVQAAECADLPTGRQMTSPPTIYTFALLCRCVRGNARRNCTSGRLTFSVKRLSAISFLDPPSPQLHFATMCSMSLAGQTMPAMPVAKQ